MMFIQTTFFCTKWSHKGFCVWYITTNATLQLNWFFGLMHFVYMFSKGAMFQLIQNTHNNLYWFVYRNRLYLFSVNKSSFKR